MVNALYAIHVNRHCHIKEVEQAAGLVILYRFK